jgi:hypothetical protein
MVAILEHLPAIHEDILYADRILMRFGKGGAVCDRGGIEDNDIGEHPFLKTPAMI